MTTKEQLEKYKASCAKAYLEIEWLADALAHQNSEHGDAGTRAFWIKMAQIEAQK